MQRNDLSSRVFRVRSSKLKNGRVKLGLFANFSYKINYREYLSIQFAVFQSFISFNPVAYSMTHKINWMPRS